MSAAKDPLEDLALALYYRVAELLKAGKNRDQIIYEMGLQGVKRETVEMMLERLKVSQRNVERRRGWTNVFVGAVILFLSLGLTFGWFGLPYVGGLAIIPALIALAAGAYWFVRGLLQVAGW